MHCPPRRGRIGPRPRQEQKSSRKRSRPCRADETARAEDPCLRGRGEPCGKSTAWRDRSSDQGEMTRSSVTGNRPWAWKTKLLIGVVHLQPLPGSPCWQGDLEAVIQSAVQDAVAYERGGAKALSIENFGDVPFTKANVGPETVAAMAAAGRAVRDAVKLPFGFNVLRNDPRAGLALCAACHGSFIRVNVHTGAMLTDQGLIEGNAYETLRYRRQICARAQIFADVHVKHAVPLGDWTIEDSARDTVERGLADALIVSGVGTGLAADLAHVHRVR